MSPVAALTLYCIVLLVASLAGGWIPMLLRLTHRRMQVALSFVSGVMLGVSLLELLPHAIELSQVVHDGPAGRHGAGIDGVLRWLVLGFLVMFLVERFFCYHHHDAPDDPDPSAEHGHAHKHAMTWSGATIGLTIHTLIAGLALAAAVMSDHGHDPVRAGAAGWVGFSTFLVIVLHKPFDSLTIGTLMAARGSSSRHRHLVNALFSFGAPVGVALFFIGAGGGDASPAVLAAALGFSAGTFLCIALSDVLPELQFHAHDRVLLSVALVAGLLVAGGVSMLEHGHSF